LNVKEENTTRIDEFDNEKFNFEQEINERDRQITERDEKIQDLELNLKRSQESGTKLRQALKETRGSRIDNDQTNTPDAGKILLPFFFIYNKLFRNSITKTN
jgi:uncharacterized protein (DUF3084 family)